MMLYERGNAAKQWILTDLEQRFSHQPFRVLDLACGDGSKWPAFLEAHPHASVVGLDTDARAIARGQGAHARLTLHVADAQQRLHEGSFQAVTAFSAMEHVVDHAAFLTTVWQALAPGGFAYLNYDVGHFRSRNLKERLMVPVSQMLALVGMEGPYMKRVDDARFRAQAEAQGFRICAFRKHNIASLKGLMPHTNDEGVRAWYALEERVGAAVAPDVLDAQMLSSTLVLQKPDQAPIAATVAAPRASSFARSLLAWGAVLLTAFAFLNPNPFGNAAPVIADESYFLATAVRALQDLTLPGFVFGETSAYYGAPLTYALFGLLLVGGVAAVMMGAATGEIASWIAFHWGDLMHAGRLLNGLAMTLFVVLWGRMAWRDLWIPAFRSLGVQAFVALAAFLGSTVLVALAHTSKVWPLELIAFLAAGWMLVKRLYRVEQGLAPNGSPERFVQGLFAWALLGFSQTLFFSLAWTWVVWALVARVVTLRQVARVFVRLLPLIVAVVLLQASMVRGFVGLLQQLAASGDVAGTAFGTGGFVADRLVWPWVSLVQTHPVLMVCALGAAVLFALRPAQRTTMGWVLLGQIMFIFSFFHVIVGFSRSPRYALPLGMSVALFVAFMVARERLFRRIAVPVLTVAAVLVVTKTAWLFWQPSTVTTVLTDARARVGAAEALVLETPYLSFPVVNDASRAFAVMQGSPLFARYTLLADTPYIEQAPSFLVSYADPAVVAAETDQPVWVIGGRCGAQECPWMPHGTVHEGLSLWDLLRVEAVGYPLFLTQYTSE